MKYWLLTTEYPPFYGGGISTYCEHTVKMLEAHGDEVTVFIPDATQNNYAIVTNELSRIVKFNPAQRQCSAFLGHEAAMSYSLALTIIDCIRNEGKPDVIEVQDYLALGYYTLQFKHLLYQELASVHIILTLHSPAFLYLHYNREGSYKFPNYWIGEMEKSCLQCADCIISPSEYLVHEVSKHFEISPEKFTIIRNPFLRQNEPALFINEANTEITFFGKLSPQKGVFEMFKYLSKMWDAGFERKLNVIGGTEKVYYPEMKTMGQLIQEKYARFFKKGLIKFTGKIPPTHLQSHLSNSSIVLIPSINDNLPYAAIEAMCLGKVIVASKQGGQAELIEHGVNGFIFDHECEGDFEQKLLNATRLNADEALEMGTKASQTVVEKLSYDSIYKEKIEKIRQVRNSATNTFFPFTRPTITPEYSIPSGASPGNILLSVIVPYYNMGAYIDECISSILNSDYELKEIIIVNDGSTEERSISALHKYRQIPYVKIVDQDNMGLAKSRNIGSTHAKGTFIAFLDADDQVLPNYYSKAIKVLTQYSNVYFCGAWVEYFQNKSGIWPTWNPEPPYILLHNSVNSSSLVYKKEAFTKAGLNDPLTDYGIEDYESVIHLISAGYGGVVLPEPLFRYRIRRKSMYRQLSYYKTLYSYQYIANKYKSLYGKYGSELYALQNSNGPSYAFDNPSFETKVISRQASARNLRGMLKKVIKKYPRVKAAILFIKANLNR